MSDKQRKFWLSDEVEHSNRINFAYGWVYGVLSTLTVILAYEFYTGYPVWDYLLRLLGDNRL